ncbi:putative beta-glucosidase C [Colletotrichum chlorophyti]|uniref:beta-glucosidase n=1 Tax=Colletotrichum chlorophyti TaxID=708187 RepID=A0A1Q8RBZ5_9PEZI|nr:putative beta-glucosidase C [Colletotrichum chlorophyti]
MRSQLTALALAVLPLGASCTFTYPDNVKYSWLARRDKPLPIYKNASYCIDERVEDLIKRMTIEEKAGQLFQVQLTQGPNGTLDPGNVTARRNSTDNMIGDKFMTHFNLVGDINDAREVAELVNRVQQRALDTRLGIPVTLSTDPRHHFTENIGTGFRAGVFSQWPETMGLAALRDPHLVRTFAEVAREEYIAVGIRAALHPQVDLATEPRWARLGNTWGEDVNLTSELLVEYIKGLQGEKLGPHSVTTVTKHFPGGGPMENGEDSHFTYGKNQTYPGKNFAHHLIPFKAAIAAGARQMMPYYSRPIGTKYDPVGFSFNKQIVTDLLRNELGFQGIVVTDWGLITDTVIRGQDMPARAWGLENTTELERVARILDAGCDQFGGEQRTELVVQLVKEGVVAEERIDVSVRRLLREKFILGLFDNPFVDPEAAARVVGNDYFARLGNDAQRRAYTLLSNKENILPLKQITTDTKFYIEGFNATFLEGRNLTVVKTPEEAHLALLRLEAPYEPRPGGFEAAYHAGSLEYSDEEKARQAAIYSTVPTIVDVIMDRPAAVPEVIESASAVFASFGSGTDAFLDVVFGISAPEGKLPFDLPRSQKAVEESKEDLPFDTKDPVFKFGHGLRYASKCSLWESGRWL